MRSHKCAWTLLEYERVDINPKLAKQSQTPGEIYLEDDDGQSRPIKRYENDHGREYLGVKQTATGKELPQYTDMLQDVEEWNTLIQQSTSCSFQP